jgi:hypothetical protein
MRFTLEVCSNVAGIPLEVLILSALLHGAYRRYPGPFVYVLTLFMTTVLETSLYVAGYIYRVRYSDRHIWIQWHSCYWIDQFILMVLEFALVIGFIYQATAAIRPRRVVRLALSGGAILFAAVAFAIHYNPRIAPGLWMTPWASNLHLCAAILDMALWAMLVASRKRDQTLLLLAAGLGIEFTGGAIGASVRDLALAKQSLALNLIGGIVIIASNLAFLYIWRQALRWQPQRANREALAHTS